MNKTNPNDPITGGFWMNTWHEGLTKREYFAALAMQGINIEGADFGTVGNPKDPKKALRWHAEICIAFADALIEELNKNG